MPAFTVADIKYELDNLRPHLTLEETEDSWEKIAKALLSLIKLCENGAYDASPVDLLSTVKTLHRPIISAMNSERTRLCMVPMDLMGTLATAMGRDFEQLLSLFMPALLTQCARTNKVIINRAKSSILTIIEVTQLASVLSYFLQNIKDKSATMKVVIAEGTLACLNSCNPPDVEKEARATEVESIIRATARDANADVRKLSRNIFESYKILLPSRVQNFTAPLSPITKKYLDIKTTSISTQKSTSNLRANMNLKPEVKSSHSTSSSTANATKPGHTRTASSSTVSIPASGAGSQMRNQPPTLTRVTRKEPTTFAPAPAPYVPVRPVQPSRVMTDTQKINPQRFTNAKDGANTRHDKPLPTLRSKPSIISRSTTGTASASAATTSGAPHRIQLEPRQNASAAAGSGSQTLPSTGPQRIPMPPPPPPAPKKDTEGAKRPASRVDNAMSTTSTTSRPPIVPPAPVKKKTASTVSSALKDRAPAANPVAVTRSKSSTTIAKAAGGSATAAGTSNATAKTAAGPAAPSGSGAVVSTKPLAVAKTKPLWGRSAAPAAKPIPATGASQKAQTVKAVVRKPSSRFVPITKNAAAGPAKRRPVTPAMIALPPSPTPEEPALDADADVESTVQNNKENEHVDLEQTTQITASQCNSPMVPVVPTPEVEATERQDENDEQTVNQDEQTETITVAPIELITRSPTPAEEETTTTPVPQAGVTSDALDNNDDPHTPQQRLMPQPSAKNALSSKTPISALLSSIERGFKYDYSPITPLSPADNYLPNVTGEGTPYSHATHAPHLKGPMQPFNHALHVPGHNGMFDGFAVEKIKKEEELVRGDIGVVQLSEYNKIYMAPGLPGLDDGRLAFVELNRS